MSRLRESLEGGRFGEIRALAHNLRGSGAGYGFQPVSDLGDKLGKAAAAEDRAALHHCIDELEEYLREVRWSVGQTAE